MVKFFFYSDEMLVPVYKTTGGEYSRDTPRGGGGAAPHKPPKIDI
jgi:hypothetical protein